MHYIGHGWRRSNMSVVKHCFPQSELILAKLVTHYKRSYCVRKTEISWGFKDCIFHIGLYLLRPVVSAPSFDNYIIENSFGVLSSDFVSTSQLIWHNRQLWGQCYDISTTYNAENALASEQGHDKPRIEFLDSEHLVAMHASWAIVFICCNTKMCRSSWKYQNKTVWSSSFVRLSECQTKL